MKEAQEVENEGHAQILERVCAIDVAKASGKVCTRGAASVPARGAADPGLGCGCRHERGPGIPQATVEGNFKRYGLLDERVRFLAGWFKDTLQESPIDQISVLRLDGDLYESTIHALGALYPRLSIGVSVL